MARELEPAIAGGKIQGPSPRPYAQSIARRLRENIEDIDPPAVQVGPGPEAISWCARAFALANEIAPHGEAHHAMRLRDLAAAVRDGHASAPDERPDEVLDHWRRARGEEQVA